MFAARVKSQLKVAKDRLQARRFQDALDAANDALHYEPENTTALLFKAAALQNLAIDLAHHQDHDTHDGDDSNDNVDYDLLHQARDALELATKIKPDLAPAWNGLEKVYEKLGDNDALVGALERLLDLFHASRDSKRLTDTLAKLISLHLASSNLALADDSIRLQLPNSRIHSKLASPPPPIDIWRHLASLHEEHDARKSNQLVAQRRALLGAPPEPIVRAAAEAEVAIAASRRVEAYEHILQLAGQELEPEVVSKYLGLLQTQAATGQVPAAASKMNTLVDKCVAAAAPVLIAYQIALDNTDISTVSDYPRTLLEPASRTSASSDADRDYALAATWILSGTEPADLSADPSSLFPAMVAALLSDDDPVILAASRTALGLITARKSRAYPKAVLAVRLRRAEVFVRTQQAHNARSELDAVASELANAEAASQLRAEQIRGDAAVLLAEPHVARKHYARAVDLADDLTSSSPSANASATWVRSSLAWTDYQLGTLDTPAALSALSAIDPSALSPTLHATHLYRLAHVSYHSTTPDAAAHAYTHLLAAAQLAPTGVPAIYTLLGRVFATHRRDAARAAKCWSKALALDPTDDEAGVWLSEHYVRASSDWERAEKVLEGVTKVKPRAHEAWKRLGLVRMAAEKWEAAVVALQFAVRTMPAEAQEEERREETGQVWSTLGEAYIQLGRWATAVKALTEAHTLVPDCPATRYLLAQAHFKLSQFIQATEYLADTDSTPCVILAGQVYLHHALSAHQAGRYKECAKLIAEGIENLESHVSHADSSLVTKTLGDLRTAWSAVPHHCPDLAAQLELAANEYASAGFLGESGAAYLRLAQLCPDTATDALERAESNLTRAITSTPPSVPRDSPYLSPVWTALGTVYAMQNAPRRAQHCLILALRGNPTSPIVWTNLAALYTAHGDTPLAVESLERAVAADAEHPDPWVLRAVAAAADGAHDQAAAHVKHAVTSGLWMSPLLAQAVAESSALRDSHEHAIDVEMAALKWAEFQPVDPAAWTALACAYERAGNMRDAVAAMKQAVKLNRGDLRLIGNLARMLAGSEPARAADLLKRVPGGGWGKWLVLACAEHANLGSATDEVLSKCLEEITDAPDEAKHLLAQLMYKSGAPVAQIVPLVAHSAPGILCALGMLAGDEQLVAAGFARAAPAKAQYLASIHHVLQGELVAAQRALERAVHGYPGDVVAVARLARFLARYSPNRAQVAIAEEVARREMATGDPTAALGMAATGLLAVSRDVREAIRMAQRQVMARPSEVKAWKQLGVAVLAANEARAQDTNNQDQDAGVSSKLVVRLASYPLAVDPDSPFSHLLASAGALAQNDPAQAMHHVEQAVALISASAGADSLPNVVYRQLARVLLSNGETEAALDVLKRALDAPVGADTVSQAVRAGAIMDLAHLYAQVGWTQEAQALVVHAAEDDEHLPASAKVVLLAFASALAGLGLDAVQRAVGATKELVGGGGGDDAEGDNVSHPLLEQARGLLALAIFKAGSKGKGAKLMASVKRSDMLQVFSAMGGTIQAA